MADNVTIPATGSGSATPLIATDEVAVNGGAVAQVQYVKLVDGAGNGTQGIPGDNTNGIDVDVTRVSGVVHVDDNSGSLTVDNAGTFVVQDSQVITDNAAFTDGTSKVLMAGYAFDELAGTALTENDAAAARIDSKRAQIGVIEDATTRGQRAAVSAGGALKVDGSAVTQPVSGTVTANAGSGPFPVSDNAGSLTVDAPVATPVAVRLSDGAAFISALPITDNAGSITVDQATGTNLHTVIDSGTVSTITNVVHVDDNAGSLTIDSPGVPTALGQSTMANSMRVVVASDQSAIPVSQSGTWNVGTVTTLTGITNVVHVDDNAASLTIDSAGIPTALGQSTMANSMRVVIASDQTAVPASQSGTWNIGTVTTLTGITNVVHVDDNAGSLTVDSPQLPAALGQGTMSQGLKVALASDQSAIPVSQSGTWNVANTGTFAVQVNDAAADLSTTKPSVGLLGGWDDYTLRSATVKQVDGQNRLMVFDPKVRNALSEALLVLQDIRNLLMTGDTSIVVSGPPPNYT